MKRIAMLALLAAAPPAWAGVYNTEERLNPLITAAGAAPMEFGDFKALRSDRRDPFAGKDGNDLKKLYTQKANELGGKVFAGSATAEDKINLSAYLIGLGKYPEAANLLEPEARGGQRGNFMVLANLATAYFLDNQLERAFDYQQLALENWPKQAAGYTPEQLQWLKGVETKFRMLILQRRKEAANRVTSIDGPDDIFDVRFVGPEGQYTPGKLPEGQKLPANALATAQQLVLWLPHDNRVYWLLAEVLNAQGQQSDTLAIFDELIWGGYNVPEMKRHRSVIQEAMPTADAPPPMLTLTPKVVTVLVIAAGLAVLFVFLQVRDWRRRQGTPVGQA